MDLITMQLARRNLRLALSKRGLGRLKSTLTLDNILEITGGEFHGDKSKLPKKFSNVGYPPEVEKFGLALAANPRLFQINREIDREEAIKWAQQALENGASCVLSSVKVEFMPCIVVRNPAQALLQIMTEYMKKFPKLNVIAVTGSIGKTSLAHMAGVMFNNYAATRYHTISLNTLRACAQTAQSLVMGYKFWVQEFAEAPVQNYPGILSQMLSPSVGIVTKISDAHLDSMGSMENIIESCVSIADGLRDDGIMVMNGDDPYQRQVELTKPTVFYGIESENLDYRAIDIEESIDGTKFKIAYEDKTVPIQLSTIGRHNIYNALSCFAAAKAMDIADEVAAEGISDYHPSGIRQNLVGLYGRRVYLDCYNANKGSIRSALETIASIDVKGSKAALIGSLAEEGDVNIEDHIEVGKIVAEFNLDKVIFHGPGMKEAMEAYEEAGGKNGSYYPEDEREELVKTIQKEVLPGDLLLVKGGRDIELEKIIDAAYNAYYSEPYRGVAMLTPPLVEQGYKYRDFGDYVVIEGGKRQKVLDLPIKLADKYVCGLGTEAYAGRKAPEQVRIAGKCQSVRIACFEWGTNLKVVELGPALTLIDDRAFAGCTRLHRIVLHDGLDRIGKEAFYGCKELKELRLPNSVTHIGPKAFEGCGPLEIYVEEESPAEKAIESYVSRHPKSKIQVISLLSSMFLRQEDEEDGEPTDILSKKE